MGGLGLLVNYLAGLKFWQWICVIAGVMILISGPAMIMAWLKLRKRNLSPVLNANGWAVNAKALVNIPFGSTLTSLAKMPRFVSGSDPFAEKMATWKKILIALVVIILAISAWMHFMVGIDLLDWIRLHL